MKSTVESLSPTRVRLAVEVPFDEIKPSLDKAYRAIAGQVRVPGFRPGKVPARIIDQRVGRAAVLEEAVNDAIPQQYAAAVIEHDVKVLGQPSVDVTEFADGQGLKFTAEVDVRPDVTLVPYDGLTVTVEDLQVADSEVDEQIDALRERFAVLKGVDREVQLGDYVSIDLRALLNGEEVEDGSTTGLSYEVGSGNVVPGLDDALVGMAKGEDKTFPAPPAGGQHAGEPVEVTVTVRSVKEKELPEVDDDLAQTTSEYDTLAELHADIRERLTRIKRNKQGMEARDKVLEALLAAIDVPLPESVVRTETEYRKQAMEQQLTGAGLTLETYLGPEGSPEAFEAELQATAENAVKAQLILDAVADQEQVAVSDMELTEEVVRRAQRAGVSADQYVQQVVQSGQIPALAADVRRGKALVLVSRQASIKDASGNPVELEELKDEPAAAEAHDHDHDHAHDHDH
ncbi:MAG: trigger factor [Actinomycetota bacterium]|nr:trigger factor [Actinomycetota bacterium]